MLTKFKRITKTGWQNFYRNSWLSAATVSVVVLTLIVLTALILVNVLTQSLLATLQSKVDISVYFNQNTDEQKILEARKELVELNEVKSIEYISQDEALSKFKETHKDNPVLIQSLDELDSNPLQPSLNIKAQYASQYENIVSFLQNSKFKDLINKINYQQNKEAITRLASISRTVEKTGLVAGAILAVLAILVTFNTIRLTMYNRKDEIGVMRLVGASNWYIRGPFLVEGMLYGFMAAMATLIITYPTVRFISPKITRFLPGSDLSYFFQSNLWSIFLLLAAIGIFLGCISSLIAIRRYLKI